MLAVEPMRFAEDFEPARARALRLAGGLTQTQVGDRLGVTRQAVSGFERAAFRPAGKVARRYAELLAELADGILKLQSGGPDLVDSVTYSVTALANTIAA